MPLTLETTVGDLHQQRIPFEVAMPNEETRRAIEDARARRDLIEAESVDELIGMMDAED